MVQRVEPPDNPFQTPGLLCLGKGGLHVWDVPCKGASIPSEFLKGDTGQGWCDDGHRNVRLVGKMCGICNYSVKAFHAWFIHILCIISM